jgi:hypothetical protein
MQVPTAPQQPGKPALRSGAILGIALGIIHCVMVIILTEITNSQQITGANPKLPVILTLLIPLIWIVGLLTAGAWGGQSTGKVSTGTLAGLFAGTFGSILAGFGQIIATELVTTQPGSTTDSSFLLASGMAAIFYVMFLAIGFGAGLGALGGLVGQSISPVRSQAAVPVQPVYAPPVAQIPYPYTAPQQVPLPQQPPVRQQVSSTEYPAEYPTRPRLTEQ